QTDGCIRTFHPTVRALQSLIPLARVDYLSIRRPPEARSFSMSDSSKSGLSRRELFKNTGKIAAASALAQGVLPGLYAGASNTFQLALVGCGGRGTGAEDNALSTTSGPTKLVAMADVFPHKIAKSFGDLSKNEKLRTQMDIPEDRRYIGFDAYKK